MPKVAVSKGIEPSFCRRRRRELPLHDPDDDRLQFDLRQVDPAGFGPVLERADFNIEGLDAFGKRLAIRRFGKVIPDGPGIVGIARADIGVIFSIKSTT
jgi:hypothetical protein